MPDGRVHTSVTVLTAVYSTIILGSAVATAGAAPSCLAMVAGEVAGVFLSPDLDVDRGYIGASILRRRLGWLPAVVWRAYWWPYAKLVPHRSWVSHFPVVSTLIRVAYTFWWVLLVPGAVNSSTPWAAWALAGLIVVDFNHIFLDLVHPDKEDWR